MVINQYTTFRAAFAPGAPPDNTGFETWPVDLVRANGFANVVTMVTPPPLPLAYPFNVTCNGSAPDSVINVDEYDWWVSQRTDDPALQYLNVARTNASGTIRISLNAGNVAKLLPGNPTPTTPDLLAVLFNRVTVYCRRRSDGAIDLLDLLGQLTSTP